MEELTKTIEAVSQEWKTSSYMHGLVNGLILAKAILEDVDPKFVGYEWPNEVTYEDVSVRVF